MILSNPQTDYNPCSEHVAPPDHQCDRKKQKVLRLMVLMLVVGMALRTHRHQIIYATWFATTHDVHKYICTNKNPALFSPSWQHTVPQVSRCCHNYPREGPMHRRKALSRIPHRRCHRHIDTIAFKPICIGPGQLIQLHLPFV